MARRSLRLGCLLLLAVTALACGNSENKPDSSASGTDSGSQVVSAAALQSSALAAADTFTKASLMSRTTTLSDDYFAGRDNGSPGGIAAREWLVADLKKLKLAPAAQSGYDQPFDKGANVCARVPGSDPTVSHEVVLIGAHYDHLGTAGVKGSQCKAKKGSKDLICNGAIDNAAGVSVAISVVHALANSTHPPRRTLILCLFDAEEDGLLGSRYFVDKAPLAPLDSIVAMLSVDNVGSEIFPGEMSSFATDVEFSDTLRAAVKTANKASGYNTWPVSSFFVGQEGGGRSDHLPFREAGVPVLFIGSGSSAEYHTTADELGAINQNKLLQIARHTAVLVATIANAKGKPDFIKTPKPHIDDALAMASLADTVISQPKALGLNDAQLSVVKGFRKDLQKWIDKPPETDAEWATYQSLIKAIVAAVYTFAK
ncbi:MAG: M20/M25/M40 family metallo-hydrolase [Myxococcales bacterium]|nr:M20/M25/M40 family metallo-hydrolase [Myxococcales bacterium]